MEQIEVEANMKLAKDFIDEATKWGKHVVMPFFPLVLRDIFAAYEQRISDVTAAAAKAAEITDEAHQRHVSELNGKIGGLTKKLNKQDA